MQDRACPSHATPHTASLVSHSDSQMNNSQHMRLRDALGHSSQNHITHSPRCWLKWLEQTQLTAHTTMMARTAGEVYTQQHTRMSAHAVGHSVNSALHCTLSHFSVCMSENV